MFWFRFEATTRHASKKCQLLFQTPELREGSQCLVDRFPGYRVKICLYNTYNSFKMKGLKKKLIQLSIIKLQSSLISDLKIKILSVSINKRSFPQPFLVLGLASEDRGNSSGKRIKSIHWLSGSCYKL